MTPKTLLVLLSLLASAPLVFADAINLGIPDISCQVSPEWYVHDYGPPAFNDAALNVRDGNLEECDNTYGFFKGSGSQECRALEDQGFDGPGHPFHLAYVSLCKTDRPADWDGDAEYAQGGAILVSNTGDGASSGGLACYGTWGHHPQAAPVFVVDLVHGTAVPFSIGADYSSPLNPPLPGTPDCGDGTIQPCKETSPPPPSDLPQPVGGVVDTVNALMVALMSESPCTPGDVLVSCPIQFNGICTPLFAPGADGAYHVYVGRQLRPATQGHISM